MVFPRLYFLLLSTADKAFIEESGRPNRKMFWCQVEESYILMLQISCVWLYLVLDRKDVALSALEDKISTET